MKNIVELLGKTNVVLQELNEAMDKMFESVNESIDKAPKEQKVQIDNLKRRIERAFASARKGDVESINNIIKDIKDEYKGN